MNDDREIVDYEVGYRKPPKSGQFEKGKSGNPSGRPKKPSDFGSKLRRELDSKLIVNENGKRKVITKSEGVLKQLLNKSLSGHDASTRLQSRPSIHRWNDDVDHRVEHPAAVSNRGYALERPAIGALSPLDR
jgi:hypothetical protein